MKASRTLFVGLGFLLLTLLVVSFAVDYEITAVEYPGKLTWSNEPRVARYTVEWASSPTGTWHSSWDSLTDVYPTVSTHTVNIPMFYRVSGSPYGVLLVHGDGVDGSTSITDEYQHVMSAIDSAHISTNEKRFGTASIYLDGLSDHVSTAPSSDWAFGTNDFTIELFAYYISPTNDAHLIGPHSYNVYADWVLVNYRGDLQFSVDGVPRISYEWTPASNTWYHIAATRRHGTYYLFRDGTLVGTAAGGHDIANTRALTLGASDNWAMFHRGYLDEIRVLVGVGLWTNDFTPPSQPYEW